MCTGVEPSSGVRVTLVNRVGASLCDPGALPGAGRRAGPWLHPLWARLPGQFLSHRRLPRPALSWLPGLLLNSKIADFRPSKNSPSLPVGGSSGGGGETSTLFPAAAARPLNSHL